MKPTAQTPEGVHEFAHQVQEEHLELRAKLRQTAASLNGPQAVPADTIGQLTELRDQLVAHFKQEEEHGLFSDLEQQAPWLSKRVKILLDEHRNLLALANDLLEGAQGTAGMAELKQDFQVLNRWLADHEQRENHLLLEAYDDDIGDKD